MTSKQTSDALQKMAHLTGWPELHEAVTQIEMLTHLNGELVKALESARLYVMAREDREIVTAALEKAREAIA